MGEFRKAGGGTSSAGARWRALRQSLRKKWGPRLLLVAVPVGGIVLLFLYEFRELVVFASRGIGVLVATLGAGFPFYWVMKRPLWTESRPPWEEVGIGVLVSIFAGLMFVGVGTIGFPSVTAIGGPFLCPVGYEQMGAQVASREFDLPGLVVGVMAQPSCQGELGGFTPRQFHYFFVMVGLYVLASAALLLIALGVRAAGIASRSGALRFGLIVLVFGIAVAAAWVPMRSAAGLMNWALNHGQYELLLHRAVRLGAHETQAQLLELGTPIRPLSGQSLSPFHAAVAKKDAAAIALLLEHGAQIDAPAFTGRTALQMLAEANEVELARMLLERGAAVDVRGRMGDTPLMTAMGQVRSQSRSVRSADQVPQIEMVRLLIDHGADPGAENDAGSSPATVLEGLSKGAPGARNVALALGPFFRGSVDPEAYLNSQGYSFNAQHFVRAAEAGNRGALEQFLTMGMDIDAISHDDETAISVAASAGRDDLLQWLLDRGADINARDEEGRTNLHRVIRQNDKGAISALLRYGADPNARDEEGRSPLFYAISARKPEVLAALLEGGGSANAVDARGESLLIAAARYERTGISGADFSELLLRHGADANFRDRSGRTALDWARLGERNGRLTDLLRQYGAAD